MHRASAIPALGPGCSACTVMCLCVLSEPAALTFDKHESKQLTFLHWTLVAVLPFAPGVPIRELPCYSFQDQKLPRGLMEVQAWKEVAVLQLPK